MGTIPFIGRDDFLSDLANFYDSNKLIMVHGLKSIGKTRTISEFLNRRRIHGSIFNEIQINLTEENIEETIGIRLSVFVCLNFAQMLKLEEIITPLINAFNERGEVEFVIIIDNCEHMFQESRDIWSRLEQFCCQLTQTCSNVHIITITSLLPVDLSKNFVLVELKPLLLSESCMLLRHFIPDRVDGVEKVAELCLGLPLALIMVGAELTDNSLEDITEFLLYSRIQALSSEFYPAKDRLDFNYGTLVMRLAPTLKENLAALQYIPGSFSKTEAFEVMSDDVYSVNLETSLTDLEQCHIVSKETTCQQRFNIHGILRDCIEMFLIIKDIPAVRKRFCKAYAAVMRDISTQMNNAEYVEAITLFSLEYPNLQKLLREIDFATNDTFHVFIDMVKTSAVLLHDFMGGESLPFYKQCMRLIPSYGTKLDEAMLKWGIGEVLTDDKGDFSGGEECYRSAIKLLSDTTPYSLLVKFRTSLGMCLYRAGKQLDSMRELQYALEEASTLGMKNEPIMTTCIRCFATVQIYYNVKDSEKYYTEALNRAIEYHGCEDNVDVAKCYNGLGINSQRQGKNDIALEYFEKGLKVKKKCRMSSKFLVMSMNNIAMRYSLIGRKIEAYKLLQDGLILLQRTNSEHMISRLATLENLARIQLRLQNYDSAFTYIDEVIAIRRLHSPVSIIIFEMLELKGINYMHLKRYDAATYEFEQVIRGSKIIFEQRPSSLLVYESYISLLECYVLTGKQVRFMETYEEATLELSRLKSINEAHNLSVQSYLTLTNRLKNILCSLKPIIQSWNLNLTESDRIFHFPQTAN